MLMFVAGLTSLPTLRDRLSFLIATASVSLLAWKLIDGPNNHDPWQNLSLVAFYGIISAFICAQASVKPVDIMRYLRGVLAASFGFYNG